MTQPADNALITFDEYVTLLNQDVDNINLNKNRKHLFINSESQRIEDYCERNFITPSADITEIFDGDGTSEYFVKHRRIASDTTPSLQYRISTPWNDNNTGSYPIDWDNDKGKIWFVKFNRTFHEGDLNWRVAYKYGWSQDSLPTDLKVMCAELVWRAMMLLDGKEGLSPESFGDSSTTYNLASMPDNIKDVLNRYRRIQVG